MYYIGNVEDEKDGIAFALNCKSEFIHYKMIHEFKKKFGRLPNKLKTFECVPVDRKSYYEAKKFLNSI